MVNAGKDWWSGLRGQKCSLEMALLQYLVKMYFQMVAEFGMFPFIFSSIFLETWTSICVYHQDYNSNCFMCIHLFKTGQKYTPSILQHWKRIISSLFRWLQKLKANTIMAYFEVMLQFQLIFILCRMFDAWITLICSHLTNWELLVLQLWARCSWSRTAEATMNDRFHDFELYYLQFCDLDTNSCAWYSVLETALKFQFWESWLSILNFITFMRIYLVFKFQHIYKS